MSETQDQVDRLGVLVRVGNWPAALSVVSTLSGSIKAEQQKQEVEHIRGPRDGRWWQLYTVAPELAKKVQAATKDLNAALDGALAQIAASGSRAELALALGLDPRTGVRELAYALLDRNLSPVMRRHAEAGACDSEPRDAALDALEDAIVTRGRGMEDALPPPELGLGR